MLSIETESKIAKLFVLLYEAEKSIETARIVLADQLQFDANKIFFELDRNLKNYIDEYDIIEFLK